MAGPVSSLQKRFNCVVTGLKGHLIRLQGTSMAQYHHFFLSFLIVISPYLIRGAPTSASISLPEDDASPPYYCTDSLAWSGPTFNPKNCATAVSQFYLENFERRDVLFEFLAVGGRAQSRYPSQKTPQKFTYGELPYESVEHLAEKRRSAFAAMHCSRWLIWSNL